MFHPYCVTGLVILWTSFFISFVFSQTETLRAELPFTVRLSDPESLVASGRHIPLAGADQYALEQIPGVGSTLAENILERKEAILKMARSLPTEESWRALEIAHGVGEKTALTLKEYLDLMSSADTTPAPPPPSASSRRIHRVKHAQQLRNIYEEP